MILKVLNKPQSLLEKIISHSSGILLFSLLCIGVYEQNQRRQQLFFEELHQKLEKLHREKAEAIKWNAELKLRIDSQNDPEYIKLTLMKVLGVVPEGQTKIFFQKKAPPHD